MKKKNSRLTLRVLSAAAVTTMMLGASAFAANSDINGHWAESYLQQFIDNGYLSGYKDGTYKPDNNITRAEIATLVSKIEGYTDRADVSKYKDVITGQWYYNYVAEVVGADLMIGTGKTTWSPNTNITREQVCVIVCKLEGLELDTKSSDADLRAELKELGFKDTEKISKWAVPYVYAAVKEGYMEGTNKQLLNAQEPITRAEAVTLLSKCMAAESESVYVTMNIPYDKFYEAEISNDVAVDTVTSATASKWQNQSGTYYSAQETGGKILGVQFPVKISKDALEKLGTELTEGSDYYYTTLDSEPGAYKEVTVGEDGSLAFSVVKGAEATEVEGASGTLSTSSRYGDYQLNVSGTNFGTVYGVIVHTAEGDSYGLRALENIWRNGTQLSWSTGITLKESHGNTLSYEHYAKMMGETITNLTYITDSGVYTVSFGDGLKVLTKTTATVAVENADVTAGAAAITMTDLPKDFQAAYKVTNAQGEEVEGFSCDGKKVSWTGSPAVGNYTLTVTDESGEYAEISTTFQIQTAAVVAAYDADTMSITAAEGASADDLAAYLKSVSSVSVNGKAYSTTGRGAVQVIKDSGYLDLTCSAFEGMKAGDKYEITVTATGYSTPLSFTVTIPDQIYAYASLSYGEYWAAEGVYAGGNTSNAEELDARGESDKGGYDAVSRATTNHGLHRGSFQQTVTIYATDSDGNAVTFDLAGWDGSSTMIMTDGSTAAFNKGTITYTVQQGREQVEKTATMNRYEITGIKYVPVAVAAEDYQAFVKAYDVTENGDEIFGGYGEQQLSAYTYTAAVNASTNGLKTATRKDDTWSFGKRQAGTDSGIAGQALATASDTVNTVKDYSGSYGEFVRMDITGDGYGVLGAAMQTVLWTYYGEDSTYTTPVATYGTKFAADNWMHKSMGIQLGLTESVRCQLPEGTTGEGYWTVTVYGLGYEDYTAQIEVTADNLPQAVELMTEAQKTQLTELKDQAGALLEGYDAATASDALKALKEHYDEAVAMLANADATSAEAEELLGELPGLIEAAKPQVTVKTGTATVDPTDYEDYDKDFGAEFDAYEILVDVTVENNTITAVALNADCNVGTNATYMRKAIKAAQTKYVGQTVTASASQTIDAVTGATCSSNAVERAVKDALAQIG